MLIMKGIGDMKIRIHTSTINDNPLPNCSARREKNPAKIASSKVARKYGLCPATAALVAHLAGLGPRGWRL